MTFRPLPPARRSRTALLCALALPALMALTPAAAKTLVYCSEGSPENFAPSLNTTGTSFDVIAAVYDPIVQFERGGTKVVPRWPRNGPSRTTAWSTPSICARA